MFLKSTKGIGCGDDDGGVVILIMKQLTVVKNMNLKNLVIFEKILRIYKKNDVWQDKNDDDYDEEEERRRMRDYGRQNRDYSQLGDSCEEGGEDADDWLRSRESWT